MPRPPVPFGSERFVGVPLDDVVALLGVPHLSRAALWWDGGDRRGWRELLEHRPDPDALAGLDALLSDPDADVRRAAAHPLTGEPCRDGTWATKRLRALSS